MYSAESVICIIGDSTETEASIEQPEIGSSIGSRKDEENRKEKMEDRAVSPVSRT